MRSRKFRPCGAFLDCWKITKGSQPLGLAPAAGRFPLRYAPLLPRRGPSPTVRSLG